MKKLSGNKGWRRTVRQFRLALYGGAGLCLSALPTLAATGGRLAMTQAMANVSAEFQGPLAYGVCGAGIAVAAIDAIRHRELGAVGWTGAVVGGAAGLAMGGNTLLSLIPGAAGFLV